MSMGKVNRDKKKIVLDNVHACSVSKAVWPIHTRMNTYIMYNKGMHSKGGYKLPHAKFVMSSSSQGNVHKQMLIPRLGASPNLTNPCLTGLASALRIILSLCVAVLALVLGTSYSWTTLLILPLICAIITLMVIHWLVRAEAPALRGRACPNPTDEHQQQNVNNAQHRRLAGSIEYTGTGSAQGTTPTALPASTTTSPTPEGTQPIQRQQPDNAMSFPTTPMPATPVIRVLETIDLSSTDIEHFLDT
jgi:hypothetical protein